MKILMDLCVVPQVEGVSLSPYVAACQKILDARGIKNTLHAYGTNIEGEWEEVMAAVKACHEEMHKLGSPRVSSFIKMATRTDKDQSLEDKIASVEAKMG